jgi:hypothetical protein
MDDGLAAYMNCNEKKNTTACHKRPTVSGEACDAKNTEALAPRSLRAGGGGAGNSNPRPHRLGRSARSIPVCRSLGISPRKILAASYAAWAQARPRACGGRFALQHVHANRAPPRLQWGSVVAWSSTAATTAGFVRGYTGLQSRPTMSWAPSRGLTLWLRGPRGG